MKCPMKKIISFSLWGANPKYTLGAIENAKLAKLIYPSWITRFYVGADVPPGIVEALDAENAEVVRIAEPSNWTSTFWRFYVVFDDDVEAVISRDTDSRLNLREHAAVEQWLKSNFVFHIMRDHPQHTKEILAGMWGAKRPIFPVFAEHLRTSLRVPDCKEADQKFLRSLYLRIYRYAMVHDPFFQKIPFPTKRVGAEFVGQVYEDGMPVAAFAEELLSDPRSRE
jgi:hypothetical protein